jgi:hypothetical protein
MLSVDVGFILYWLITLANVLPAEWLYAHHDDPVMVAWNWSFMPLDLLISATGLGAVLAAKRGDARWSLLAMLSLAATSASGLNAIAFWGLRGDFDLGWWAPNLVLLAGPWPFVWGLWRAHGLRSEATPGS